MVKLFYNFVQVSRASLPKHPVSALNKRETVGISQVTHKQ